MKVTVFDMWQQVQRLQASVEALSAWIESHSHEHERKRNEEEERKEAAEEVLKKRRGRPPKSWLPNG